MSESGKISVWEIFKHILRVQFTHPPHPPIKRKASDEPDHAAIASEYRAHLKSALEDQNRGML